MSISPRTSIALLIDSLKPYGAERVALDLAQAMSSEADVILVTWKGSSESNLLYVPQGVGHVHLSNRGPAVIRQLAVAGQLVGWLRRNQVAGVIGFMPISNLFATVAGLIARVPVVVTEHNIMSRARYGGGWRWRVTSRVMCFYHRRAGAIVAVSRAVADDLVASFGAGRDRIRTIYNPIDVDRIRSSADIGAETVRPRSAGEVRIVIVGRLKPAKGHDCALKALARLPENFHLDVVGDGLLLDDLRQLAEGLGVSDRAHFVGWQASATSWVKAADLVWMPSRFEGFGLVLAEAVALGVPAIAARAPGSGEIAASLLIPTFSPDDFFELASLSQAPELLRPADPERLNEFDPSRIAERYLALIRELGRARVAG